MNRFRFALLATLVVCVFSSGCESHRAPVMTSADYGLPLSPPEGGRLLMRVSAKGDQVYTLKAAEGGKFEWSAATPDAKLFDAKGSQVGTHGKGPGWTLADGGSVVAQLPPAKKVTVDPAAVPWLEMNAKEGTPAGSLKEVMIIQRIRTTGGVPPREGLDAQHVGQETRVPYTAEYLFFTKG